MESIQEILPGNIDRICQLFGHGSESEEKEDAEVGSLGDRDDGDALDNNGKVRKRGEGFGGKDNEYSFGHVELTKMSLGYPIGEMLIKMFK